MVREKWFSKFVFIIAFIGAAAGFGNLAVSLLAGVAIFGIMGWMEKTQGVAITELFTGGPPLTFIVFLIPSKKEKMVLFLGMRKGAILSFCHRNI